MNGRDACSRRHTVHDSETNPWTVTSIYAVSSVVAGILLPRIEHRVLPHLASPITVAAASAIYASIASGMIALTGIVFSMTFVMVQFSATAYSPRLVFWFARDRVMAHALGVFTATFLYALAALAWVDRGAVQTHVPLVSALAVLGLLLASVAMFVALLQRVARLQIGRTLAFTGDQGRRIIEEVYREQPPPRPHEPMLLMPPTQIVVRSGPPAAVKSVRVSALVDIAAANHAVIELAVTVGDTVGESAPLLRVCGSRMPLDARLLTAAIELGLERTFEQDPKYAIRLLVDIAIRALSAAVNDPTTAVQALDQIGDLLLRLGRRNLDIGVFRDRLGSVRVLVPVPSWDDFLNLAFDEISAYGATSVQVMRRMNALVSDLLQAVPVERRPALERWHGRLRRSVSASFHDAGQRAAASVEDRQGLGVPRRAAST